MSALSDPTAVIEQTPLTEIQLDDGGPSNSSIETTTIEPESLGIDASHADIDVIGDSIDLRTETPEIPTAAPLPSATPVAFSKRNVRGRYRSTGTGWQLELRVDIDGVRPLKKISGDFFSTTGSTTSYFGSFVVKNPSVITTPTEVRIQGTGTFTWSPTAPIIRVHHPACDDSAAC